MQHLVTGVCLLFIRYCRYGVKPGYGDIVHDGLLGVFTATATAALEWGAMPYAKGIIDNQFKHYVRESGMVRSQLCRACACV